uniref:Immunoresponsive gene 1, like n=1 Tax=Sphenodon punctatus TaxID=8508 RepID=A0A8D0GE02_SPHPU
EGLWSPSPVAGRNAREETVTSSFASFIHGVHPEHLSDVVHHRSKRMILDSIGVGLVGSMTHVFDIALRYCQEMYPSNPVSSVFGRKNLKLSPTLAAFSNGVVVHTMDFDDTWHPATHPSGAVLPALLPNGLDFLLAFNVGIEVQGRLMRFPSEAQNIPKRLHPPSVVATMGSAAATAKLLSLNRAQCTHALAICRLTGRGTDSKCSNLGQALAHCPRDGANPLILDDVPGCFGFSAFHGDYQPKLLALPANNHEFLLEKQDIAFKCFPAHLGMHWVVDAALSVRNLLTNYYGSFLPSVIHAIVLRIPVSKYINRPFPESEHQAQHSFQFNTCTALLDGKVDIHSFSDDSIHHHELTELLAKVIVEHPKDNVANFDKMYGEVALILQNGDVLTSYCDTFYGHWRKPLSRESLLSKFRSNASHVLPEDKANTILVIVDNLENLPDSSQLTSCL